MSCISAGWNFIYAIIEPRFIRILMYRSSFDCGAPVSIGIFFFYMYRYNVSVKNF